MSHFTENYAVGKVGEKGKIDVKTDRQQLELDNKLDRKPNIFTSQWVHEQEFRVERREIAIYHKDLAVLPIPLCIHGWLGRSTREHFSHPVAPSNIHVVHILAVEVG